jgi:hypothetical protein
VVISSGRYARGGLDGWRWSPLARNVGGTRRAHRRTNREKGIAYNIAYGLLTNERVEMEIV